MTTPKKSRGPNMAARDADRATELIKRYPLPRVRKETGLSFWTLARLAEARIA